MKIIVVGGGKVGTALCRSLVAENHDVILIEQDEAVLNQITKRYDIIGIAGNGANFKILEQADVSHCDIFISMTEHDEVNMVSAVLAKRMGAKETVVRVRNPEYSNPYFKEKNILGFSLVVNPELLTARYIANIIDFPNALSVEHFANGRVALMEFKLKEDSNLCQMSISQFRKKFGNIIVCAIERKGHLEIPDGDFTLEAGDKIYVKDDDGTWQVSSNAPTTKTASFKFKVPGKFNNSTTYKVYYPGKNGSNDQVTIPASQTQTTPNSTEHFGVSGDCGTATATKVTGKNQFEFKLDHQAAYLVFQPYTSNTILKDCYLTKVEVTSDDDITHTYTLDPTSGQLTGSGTGKQIVLTTQGSGTYANGFPLNTTSASVTTNGAYMVIKPGIHTLKVRYWIRDVVTYVEGTITKTLSSFNYAKNTYYDMTADLDVKNYDGNHYYMWDAQKQYWDGYEWTQNNPAYQPTLQSGWPGATTSSFYPKSKATDPTRWYNDYFSYSSSIKVHATTPHFKALPG